MVKCNKDQVERLKKGAEARDRPCRSTTYPDGIAAGRWENPTADWRIDGCIAEHSQSSAYGLRQWWGQRAETQAERRSNTRKYAAERGEGSSQAICQSGRCRRALEYSRLESSL